MNTVTFTRADLLETEILVSHVRKNPEVLGKQFRFLELDIPDDDMFLIGADRENRPHIVEVIKHFEERLLYRSFIHLRWTIKTMSSWKEAARIDTSLIPGIIYIMPMCPDYFSELFEFIRDDIPVRIINYLYLQSQDVQGFVFEQVYTKEISIRKTDKSSVEDLSSSITSPIELTHDEIMKFLS